MPKQQQKFRVIIEGLRFCEWIVIGILDSNCQFWDLKDFEMGKYDEIRARLEI